MNLLRKVLLGVALATGTTCSLTVGVQQARADQGDRFAYGLAFKKYSDAERYRVGFLPLYCGKPTFVKYCQFGPHMIYNPGFYICY